MTVQCLRQLYCRRAALGRFGKIWKNLLHRFCGFAKIPCAGRPAACDNRAVSVPEGRLPEGGRKIAPCLREFASGAAEDKIEA